MNASTRPAAADRIRSVTPAPCATGITPCPASHSWLSRPATPITVAPADFASWTAIEPTPPAAADTTTVSPGDSETARTAAYAVVPATYREPATSHGTAGGRGVRLPCPTTTNRAWL